MPSKRLEQLAHMFGLRDSALSLCDMGSPQQIQTLGFTPPASKSNAKNDFKQKMSCG